MGNGGDVPGGTPEQPVEQAAPQPPIESELRRSTRQRRPSERYPPHEYVMFTDEGEPQSYQEAVSHEHNEEWMDAMQEEMNSLHENNTYELVMLAAGKKALKNKWVFRLKIDENSSQLRYNARLVVKRFGQTKGVDFHEIFSPVVKMNSVKVVLSLAASMDLEIE